MHLAKFRLGIPLLKYETRIFHATPRKPTAFERVTLRMIDRFSKNTAFNSIPIKRLFIEILCVSDPSLLVTPTLSELIALDVIRCKGDIDYLNTLTLRDIEITERGIQMLSEDMLPATTEQNEEIFYYDPIQKVLVTESESKPYGQEKPRITIDNSVFDDVFPAEKIRTNIMNTEYRWISSSSQIDRIENLSVECLWNDEICNLDVQSGVLQMVSKSEEINNYLSSIESDESYERFIEPIFESNCIPVEDASILDEDDLEKSGAEIQLISQAVEQWPNDDSFIILGFNYSTESIPKQAPAHQAVILYDKSFQKDISIEWNADNTGCKIFLGMDHPIKNTLYVTDRNTFFCKSINAKYANKHRNVIVAYKYPTKLDDNILNDAVLKITDLIDSIDNLRDKNVNIFLKGEAQYLEDLITKFSHSSLSILEVVKNYFSTLSDIEKLVKLVDRDSWMSGLFKIITDKIASSKNIDIEHAEELLNLLALNAPYQDKEVTDFLNTIAEQIEQPKSLFDLIKSIETLRILDQKWSPIYPSKLFTEELTKSVIVQFPVFEKKLLLIKNTLFDSLNEFYQLNSRLSELISFEDLMRLEADDDYISLIKSKNGPLLLDFSQKWSQEMENLTDVIVHKSFLDNTKLSQLSTKIVPIVKWGKRLIGESDIRFKTVYVFDTSALIKHPQIVSKAFSGELFVVSKRVIDELDDKKLDETLRPNVSLAVRNLRRLSNQYLQFSDGDMSLLSPDYRMKGDNLILSVAVRYRNFNPILVTNDNNLSFKAQAEGLKAISSEEFLKIPRQTSFRITPDS